MTTMINSMPTTAPVILQAEKAARPRRLLEGAIVPTLLRLAAPNILNLVALTVMVTADAFLLRRLARRNGPRRNLARIPAQDADAAHGGERHGWRGHLGDCPGARSWAAGSC